MDDNRDQAAQDRAEGLGDEMKGRAKQAWGGLTGDRATQGQGMADEAKGKLKQGIADVKDAVNSADERP